MCFRVCLHMLMLVVFINCMYLLNMCDVCIVRMRCCVSMLVARCCCVRVRVFVYYAYCQLVVVVLYDYCALFLVVCVRV